MGMRMGEGKERRGKKDRIKVLRPLELGVAEAEQARAQDRKVLGCRLHKVQGGRE